MRRSAISRTARFGASCELLLAVCAASCVAHSRPRDDRTEESEHPSEYRFVACPDPEDAEATYSANATVTAHLAEVKLDELARDGWRLVESHWSDSLSQVVLVVARARR